MIKINSMQVTFKDQVALNITKPLQFNKGERIGIIGNNGSGKTTLLKALLGLVPYKGNINTKISPEDIAVHMQHNNFPSTVNTKDIIEGLLNTKISKDKKLQELISFFEFEDNLKKKYYNLSGGQQNRMTLLMVMYQDRELTFFDEVTSGLDFETRERLMNKINEYYTDKDATIFIVSHYYKEIENLVDKILLLDKGNVMEFGNIKELFLSYCGKTIILFEKNNNTKLLSKKFKTILAPENQIAVSITNLKEEQEILLELSENNIDFKRTSNDIELLTLNIIGGNNEKSNQI